MNRFTTSLTAFALLATAGAASAATPKKPWVTEQAQVPGRNGTERTVQVIKSGKNLETVTCRDFNMLDESFKPEAIRYAANYGPRGKAHPTMTVAGIETVRPVVLARCKARPGDHFVASVRTAMHHG